MFYKLHDIAAFRLNELQELAKTLEVHISENKFDLIDCIVKKPIGKKMLQTLFDKKK